MWKMNIAILGRRRAMVAMLAMLPALGVCAVRPPECAAPSTIAAIQDLYREGVRATLDNEAANLQQPHERERLQRLARGFIADLKITVTEIVSNGYEPKASRISCEGKIGIESPTARDGGYSVRSEFSTQSTEDAKGRFLVRVDEYQSLLRAVISQGFANYVRVKVQADAAANPRQEAQFQQKQREAEQARSGMPASSAEYVMGINVLKFKRTGEETLNFEYVSDAPGGTCSIGGTARVMGSMARVEQGPQIGACTINFNFGSGGRLDVAANGSCISQCPPNQHKLSGTYGKR